MDVELDDTLRAVLREGRRHADLSVPEVAAKARISAVWWYQLVAGARTVTRQEKLVGMLHAVDVPPHVLAQAGYTGLATALQRHIDWFGAGDARPRPAPRQEQTEGNVLVLDEGLRVVLAAGRNNARPRISQQVAAQRAGIAEHTWTRLESGAVTRTTQGTYLKMVTAIAVPPRVLREAGYRGLAAALEEQLDPFAGGALSYAGGRHRRQRPGPARQQPAPSRQAASAVTDSSWLPAPATET